MNILFVKNFSSLSFQNFPLKENSIILFPPELLPRLSLDEELAGKSNYIKTLCVKSKEFNCLCLVGATATVKDKTFWGTLVVDKGKFLGIADMTHPLSDNFDKSSALKVFDTSVGRIGLVSGDDIFFPEIPRLLRLWEADTLFFSLQENITKNARILAKSHAITNGATAVLFGKNGVKSFFTESTVQKGNFLCVKPKTNDFYISHRRCEMYGELIKKPF